MNPEKAKMIQRHSQVFLYTFFYAGIIKMFLFFFVIGGLFSSINFALNGGSMLPDGSIFDVGIIESITQLITYNGGVTFMIVSSIVLMAAATRKIVGLGSGYLGKIISFVGTFVLLHG